MEDVIFNSHKILPGVIMIDDLESALEHLSPLGQELMGRIARDLRHRLIAAADAKGWHVVHYSAFVDWVRGFADRQVWLVLDKLFPIASLPNKSFHVMVHRSWSESPKNSERQLRLEMGALPGMVPGQVVTALDDAIYSGSSMRILLEAVAINKGRVTEMIACVAHSETVRSFRNMGLSVMSKYEIDGDGDILHMRDFFPWLPYSGRGIHGDQRDPHGVSAQPRLHLAPIRFSHGDWLHVAGDASFLGPVENAIKEFVAEMGRHLGRAARVKDLASLGNAVAVPISYVGQEVNAETKLSVLLQ